MIIKTSLTPKVSKNSFKLLLKFFFFAYQILLLCKIHERFSDFITNYFFYCSKKSIRHPMLDTRSCCSTFLCQAHGSTTRVARQGTSLQDKKFPRYREVHHITITLSPSEFKWVSKYRPGISFHWPVRCCHALCLFCSSRISQWGRFKSCSIWMLFLKISDNEFSFQFFSEEATFK